MQYESIGIIITSVISVVLFMLCVFRDVNTKSGVRVKVSKSQKKYQKMVESKFREIEKFWKKHVKELPFDETKDFEINCEHLLNTMRIKRQIQGIRPYIHGLWYDVSKFKFKFQVYNDDYVVESPLNFDEKELFVLNYDKVKNNISKSFDKMVDEIANSFVEQEDKMFKIMSVKVQDE